MRLSEETKALKLTSPECLHASRKNPVERKSRREIIFLIKTHFYQLKHSCNRSVLKVSESGTSAAVPWGNDCQNCSVWRLKKRLETTKFTDKRLNFRTDFCDWWIVTKGCLPSINCTSRNCWIDFTISHQFNELQETSIESSIYKWS